MHNYDAHDNSDKSDEVDGNKDDDVYSYYNKSFSVFLV